ncbi:MAG: hypothetical protein ACLR23_00615 [Clostridia bacterium]
MTEGSEAPLPEESLTQENSSDSAAKRGGDSNLDGKQETWGPGKNVDGKPADACVQLQEKYGQYDAWFIQKDEPKVYLTFDEDTKMDIPLQFWMSYKKNRSALSFS